MDDETAANNLFDDFVINSGPKHDCLVCICEYLSLADLMSLCDFSQHPGRFIQFLNDRVISKRLVDLIEVVHQIEKVFEYFGRSMRKIKGRFTIVEFKGFLQNVIRYCKPGKITELHIEHNNCESSDAVVDDGLLAQVDPFLRRLEKILFKNVYYTSKRHFGTFFNLSRINLPSLRSLKLEESPQLKSLPDIYSNITEIYFYDNFFDPSYDELQNLFDRINNLQIFVFMCKIYPKDVEKIADCLYRRFPTLKGFGMSSGECGSIKEGDQLKFLEKFKNLTELHLGGSIQTNVCISKAIRYVPNLQLLSLYQLELHIQAPVQMRRIVQSIKQIIDNRRHLYPANDRIHIMVDNMQYQEMRVIKNINSFVDLKKMPTLLHIFLRESQLEIRLKPN